MGFDNKHINEERNHNVSKEEAIQFIKDAKMSLSVWNGKFERYYSYKGVSYVEVETNTIRTSFKKHQFDDDMQKIIYEVKKWENI